MFKMTKELISWKTGGTPGQFLLDGKLISKPIEIANTQMNYYQEI